MWRGLRGHQRSDNPRAVGRAALIASAGGQRGYADWTNPDHRLRRLVSEFIGTAGLMFILSGGAAVLVRYGGGAPPVWEKGLVLSVISGLWLVAAIYFLGDACRERAELHRQHVHEPLRELAGLPFGAAAGLALSHPQRHQRVEAALVLDQQVDVGVPAVQRRGEQQVRVPPRQRLVDEARRHRRQPRQVQPGGQARGKGGPQLGRRVLGHAEDPAEHRVVRRGLVRHERTVPTVTDIQGGGRG
jgi:hypothetical protein